MAAAAGVVTTAQVLEAHERLTRYLHAHFRRKLTVEDARDAAAEALAEADRAVEAGQRIADLERWLRRAGWRNALDAIRKLEGEAERPRERPLDLADHVERLGDARNPHEEALADAEREHDTEALMRAWGTLRPDEQRALHLRYFDELPVDDVLGVLGCTRHQYDNLVKRGVRKLREALVQGVVDPGCQACRALVLQAHDALLAPTLAAERDAHLSGCLACRAFERRQRKLLGLLPLPVAGLGVFDRLTARLHAHVSGAADAPQHGEALAGAVALSGAATAGATASSAGGGAAATAGLTKAVVAVAGAGALTAGVGEVRDAPRLEPPPPWPLGALSLPTAAAGRSKNPGFCSRKSVQPPGVSTALPRPSKAMVEVARRSMKSRSWLTSSRVPS